VIDAPLDDVVALIKDIRNNYIWDKFIVVSLWNWADWYQVSINWATTSLFLNPLMHRKPNIWRYFHNQKPTQIT